MNDDSGQERRCPGERAPITEAVCRARQERKYAGCADCEFRDEDRGSHEGALAARSEKVFKAYDIRGVVPDELDERLAERIGAATARFMGAHRLAVSRDMRTTSVAMSEALMRGIMLAGCDVADLGLASTDANYFATGFYPVDGGIQTTASHNPPEYNGFKVSRKHAVPVGAGSGLENIRNLVNGPPIRPAANRGSREEVNVIADFSDHVLSFASDIAPLKIVIDAGNGMAGRMLPPILDALPVEAKQLYFDLDGTFPNHEANPLKEENCADLQAAVRETGADLGAAFDGDADRCVFVDERGEIINCDLITALIAGALLRERGSSTVLYDVRSSRVVPEEIRKWGGIPCRERVGHAFIKATMRRRDAICGGELSGHFYFRDNYYADSGAIALVTVLNILSEQKKPFSHILAPLRRYAQTGEINYEVDDKDAKIAEIGQVFADGKIDHTDGITVEYEDWWFNVRASNTESLLRLNLEAPDAKRMAALKKRVEDVIVGGCSSRKGERKGKRKGKK